MGQFFEQKKKSGGVGVSITSLMDVLTIILVFLLANYSDEARKDNPPKFIKLPAIGGAAFNPTMSAIRVVIGKRKMEINKKQIKYRSIQRDKRTILTKGIYHLSEAVKKRQGKDKKGPMISLQADKDIPYWFIEDFLLKSAAAGITRIELQGSKEEDP